MKITVLGAGAMGGLFGAYLSKRNEVTMVDRNQSVVDTINNVGLTVNEPDGSSQVYHPRAVSETTGMDKADLIIIFLNSLFTESALKENQSIIGCDTYVMTLQNGSGHEDKLKHYVDESHIIIGTTQHNANRPGPGVTNHGGSGPSHLGCVVGDAARLRRFADEFTACGLDADTSDDVQKMIWDKMFTNVSASALTAVLQVPMGFISSDPHAWKICQTLIKEAVDAAKGMGMDFDYEQKLAEVKAVCDNSPGGLTSIYTNIRDGRLTEVDTISGSIVRAGRKCGVPTPTHEVIVELIHAMEDKSQK